MRFSMIKFLCLLVGLWLPIAIVAIYAEGATAKFVCILLIALANFVGYFERQYYED